MPPFSRVLSLCGAAVVVATAPAPQLPFEPFRFAGPPRILQPMPPGSVGLPLCGDIEADGRNDLVIVSDAGLSVDYAIGDGSYVVTLLPGTVLATQTMAARLVDFDQDGALD